jgi:hypothetical protein
MGNGTDDEARVAAVDAGQGVVEADWGSAGDVGECGHAELDGLFLAAQGRVDLGELVLGSGEADLEPFDLAEPAFALGFGDAVVQVGADLLQPAALGGVRSQE